MSLRKKIHNELITENQTKKESLIIESKIINSHLSTLKNCEDFDCVFESLVNKVNSFKKRNFSNSLINEAVFDILKSLFGDLDDSLMVEFKSRFADHINSNLKIDEQSKDCVKEAIMEVPNDEISKLMSDHDYVSEIVAHAYVECFRDNVLKTGVDQEMGTAGTELRNALNKLLDDSSFKSNLSGKISSQISDTLKGIQDRDEKLADKIRTTVTG
jgi:hypothetical protein